MKFIVNRYRYDCFENFPACDEWRMRVRIKGLEWISRNGAIKLMVDGEWYSYDLRCLNCGYSNRFLELDPLSSTEEEELEGILMRERQRLQETGETTERSRRARVNYLSLKRRGLLSEEQRKLVDYEA